MKKIIILILKGVLLWSTLLSTVFIAMAIDSLEMKPLVIAVLGVSFLIFICYKYISLEEAELLSGSKLFD